MADFIRITDVSPRDGLQNEAGVIPTAGKVELVRRLCETGVDEVEVSSFVSPKWVPQLGDAEQVFLGAAASKPPGMCFSALVPNEKGMDSFLGVNESAGRRVIDKVSLFTAASETFSRKNTNASIDETLDRFRPVLQRAAGAGLAVRVYISCVFACPFEGEISPGQVAKVVRKVLSLLDHSDFYPDPEGGKSFASLEVDLGDTIGAGTAGKTRELLSAVQGLAEWVDFTGRDMSLVLHLHDTFGRAAECVQKGLELGIRSFDGSVAGLGGCPYASTPGKRAPGNISTELLVRTVQAAGFQTNVDMTKLGEAAECARRIVAASRSSGGGAA